MRLAEALLLIQKTSKLAEPFPVRLACGFSPLHLQTFLTAHLQAKAGSRCVQITSGLYGSLADTLKQLQTFDGEAVALFIEWADLDPRLGYRSLGGWKSENVQELITAVRTMLTLYSHALSKKPAGLRVVVSLPTLALPPSFYTVGWQASPAEIEFENAVDGFAAHIAALPSVLVLNRQRLALHSQPSERYDFRSDLNTGFPYSLKHADALAEAVSGLILLPLAKKGLISDLDDTMWRGIVGEEGPDSVFWDLAGHGQIHGLYQQMLQSLASQGVLLGVASKNNADIAESAMRRSDFVLSRETLFPVEIHWEAKSTSVARILKIWNIGADSVVFVDDSPMELEEVRAAHPGMECLLFPKGDYAAAFQLLQQLRDLFGKPALSSEDAFRMKSIQSGQQFLESVQDKDIAEQFLSSAEATVTLDMQPLPEDSRVLELVNKTNQFNLNGKRFTQAEWHEKTTAADSFTAAISYQDKFGPLGKIAVLNGRKDEKAIHIETWVMSCRAFSRRIEHQVLEQIFEQTGVDRIDFAYAETAKNSPTGDFLRSITNGSLLRAEPSVSRSDFELRKPALYHQVKLINGSQKPSHNS